MQRKTSKYFVFLLLRHLFLVRILLPNHLNFSWSSMALHYLRADCMISYVKKMMIFFALLHINMHIHRYIHIWTGTCYTPTPCSHTNTFLLLSIQIQKHKHTCKHTNALTNTQEHNKETHMKHKVSRHCTIPRQYLHLKIVLYTY